MDNNELNLEQMEEVSGGRFQGGSRTELPDKAGFKKYKIKSGDSLGRIAKKNHTTVDELARINADYIKNVNDITTGRWIYLPL